MERDKGTETETKTGTETGTAERAAEAAPEAEDWRGRYEREREAFARYREEAERLRLREAYRALLAEAGVPAGRREAALRLCALGEARLLPDGRFQDGEAVAEAIRAAFAPDAPKPVPVAHPPKGAPAVTRADILAIADAGERQAAIARHHALFGF